MFGSDLDSRVTSLGHELVFWTLVVAAGLVVEYAKPVKEFFVSAYKRAFGTGSWPRLDHVIVGGLLITIGVAAEGVVEFRASRVETSLRAENNASFVNLGSLVEKAQRGADEAAQAGLEAKDSAQQAKDQGRIAKQQADEIEEGAALLRRQTEKLTQESIAMESRLERADQELEGERRKRLELAAGLLPRDFFDQSGAIARLVPFPPMTVVFEFVNQCEPKVMAEQINAVLRGLHWKTWHRPADDTLIKDGITISVGSWSPFDTEFSKNKAIGDRAARALLDGITHCGIDAEIGMHGDNFPPTTALIEVGLKPNHALEATLKELGPPPTATPVTAGTNLEVTMGGNTSPIPEGNADSGKSTPQ